jgi:hypothetical protein
MTRVFAPHVRVFAPHVRVLAAHVRVLAAGGFVGGRRTRLEAAQRPGR